MSGYILLHRSLLTNWVWEDRIFSKAEAWIDLIFLVNFAESTYQVGNEILPVLPGSRYTTVKELCERWKWSNTKVTNFLRLLQNDNMIVKNNVKKKTLLTIVNWDKYQTKSDKKASEKRRENVEETLLNNKGNEVKNEKNIYIPYEEIITYLNEKIGTSYKSTTPKTQECIRARWNEGFKLDDFKKVIDNKIADWKGKKTKDGRDCEEWLRPITLFGTKFESYLNQKGGKQDEESLFDGLIL